MDKKIELFSKRNLAYLLLIIALLGIYMLYKWDEGGMWVGHGYYRPGYFFKGKEKELAIAVERGNVKKIDQLVKEGANVNAIGKDKTGKDETTILEWAVAAWIKGTKNEKGIERLLQLGANPNFIKGDGDSVMHMVGEGSLNGDIPLLKLMLKYGGNPNMQNPVERNILSNNSPVLIKAAQFGHLENIKLLLQYGADINITDGFGMNAVMWAAGERHYDVAYYLLQRGADYKKVALEPGTINGRASFQNILKESLYQGVSEDQVPWREKVIKWLKARGIMVRSAEEESFYTLGDTEKEKH